MASAPPRWRRTVMEWLILIAVVVLGVPAWAWFTQESMIFFPQPVASTPHLPARASPLEVVATDGAVLVSPFDSMTAIGKTHYPFLPVSLLLRHRFDALPDAKRNQMPLLAIVGESDSIIPPERSRVLFDAWAGPKIWQVVPRADHNDLGNDETFWNGVAR